MPSPTHIRNPQVRAERLAYAREWHIRMKPYFDAIYGEHIYTGPACMERRRAAMADRSASAGDPQ